MTASGQVQPHTKVDISADISGRIVRLAVKEGQMVTMGQFLLEIDPSQYRASVERATAAVASLVATRGSPVRSWMRARQADEAKRVEAQTTAKLARRQAAGARASTAAVVEANGEIVKVAEMVRRAVAKADAEGLTRGDLSRTVGRYRSVLSAALSHAVRAGWVVEEEGRWKVGQ